mmetsp:Transcript_4876/g.11124  ORF Transcript_4876/g.11124 Transcript_4876/m.11124 type:complete len:103 (+) Transcript_4876:111-419(+)
MLASAYAKQSSGLIRLDAYHWTDLLNFSNANTLTQKECIVQELEHLLMSQLQPSGKIFFFRVIKEGSEINERAMQPQHCSKNGSNHYPSVPCHRVVEQIKVG